MRQVPSWPKYFMDMAIVVGSRSKDPTTNVGCLVTDKDNHIIGTGYNGFAAGMLETPELWERPTKYDYVLHAEENCLLNCLDISKAGVLFCTLYPCKHCAKLIAGTKIERVYYKDHQIGDKNYLDPISQDIFSRCEIQVTQVKT
jgi:dCMP deaminase